MTTDVVCGTCASVLAPEDVAVHRFRRLEGASDPDEVPRSPQPEP
ncbi:MAG TPA: hypothetical protein VKB57_24380 [Acidimicrobiales bacterium]|nr:hypothetical protein [Acidimicrobiales bacterium]